MGTVTTPGVDGGAVAASQSSGREPPLTPAAAEYLRAFDAGAALLKRGDTAGFQANFDGLQRMGEKLTPTDQRSLRERGAFTLRQAAEKGLGDPTGREQAQKTLQLLDQGLLPAAFGTVVRIDTGELVQPAAGSGKAWGSP